MQRVRRLLSGTVVVFDRGAAIDTVDLLSTLSCLRLRVENIGRFTLDQITTLVAMLTDKRDVADIKVTVSQPAATAFIVLRGRHEAEGVLKGHSTFIRLWKTRGITLVETPPNLPLGSPPLRHVKQESVRLSWLRPFSHVWLHYSKRATAEIVYWKLYDKRYNLGQQANSITAPRLHFFQHPREGGKFLDSWQVGFRTSLLDICSSDIQRLLSDEEDHPVRVKIQNGAVEDFDERLALEAVADKIRSLELGGQIEADAAWNYDDRTFITAEFNDEDHARQMVETFQNDAMSVIGKQQVQADIICSTQLKISAEVHELVRDEVNDITLSDLTLKTSPDKAAPELFNLVKITGVDRQKVMDATYKLENIAQGKIIRNREGVPYWSSLMTSNGVANMIKQEMKNAYGVLVVVNKVKRELRYFGPASKFEVVQTDVVELISSSSKETFTYRLDRAEFLWMRKAGYDILRHAMGGEVVYFDAKVKPHVLRVVGSMEQYQDVRRIIGLHGPRAPRRLLQDTSPTVCVICYDEAERPISLACGHRYCASCFAHMCQNTTAPHMCTPSTETCDAVIDLSSIEQNLSSTAFETVLSNSFKHYITQHPEEYRPCPTPECDSLYQPTTAVSIQKTCTQCLLQTCTLCHQQHPGTPCSVETGIQTAHQKALLAWMDRADAKRCPNCQTIIEKSWGCNHMECEHCHAHMCWVCLKTFPGWAETYKHMDDVHGGNGLAQALDPALAEEDAAVRRAMALRGLPHGAADDLDPVAQAAEQPRRQMDEAAILEEVLGPMNLQEADAE
jgi:hypothetical protein